MIKLYKSKVINFKPNQFNSNQTIVYDIAAQNSNNQSPKLHNQSPAMQLQQSPWAAAVDQLTDRERPTSRNQNEANQARGKLTSSRKES